MGHPWGKVGHSIKSVELACIMFIHGSKVKGESGTSILYVFCYLWGKVGQLINIAHISFIMFIYGN